MEQISSVQSTESDDGGLPGLSNLYIVYSHGALDSLRQTLNIWNRVPGICEFFKLRETMALLESCGVMVENYSKQRQN